MDRYEQLVPGRMASALREADEARQRRMASRAGARPGNDQPHRGARRRIGELLISAGEALAGSPTRRRHGQRPINRPA